VARSFPPKQRCAKISFTHHLVCAHYDRRHEYIKALLDEWKRRRAADSDARLPSVEWFVTYIGNQEGETTIKPGGSFVRFRVSPEMWTKLKQVSKYKACTVAEIVEEPLTEALEAFLVRAAERISLAKFGAYEEGQWPFVERKRAKPHTKRRRRRVTHAGASYFQKRHRTMADNWKNRRAKAVAL
jgi:hypothetical protein